MKSGWLPEKRIENFLEQCRVIAKMSVCKRRRFGAIIATVEGVKISDGYNGSMRGALNCGVDVPCGKDLMNEAHYTSYEYCAAVHAEQNAVFNAARVGFGIPLKGCIMFLNSVEDGDCESPCKMCRRAIRQAGIIRVYYKDKNGETRSDDTTVYIKDENRWMESRGK